MSCGEKILLALAVWLGINVVAAALFAVAYFNEHGET